MATPGRQRGKIPDAEDFAATSAGQRADLKDMYRYSRRRSGGKRQQAEQYASQLQRDL